MLWIQSLESYSQHFIFFVSYQLAKWARVLFPGRPLQPSLYVSKVNTYPSEASFRCSTQWVGLTHSHSSGLDKPGIVSRVPKWDNLVCPQTFLVRILIIGFTQKRHIYTRTERRGNRLGAVETERESVRESGRIAENKVGVRCKKRPLGSD